MACRLPRPDSHDALGNQRRAKGTGSAEEGEEMERPEDGVSLRAATKSGMISRSLCSPPGQ
jgi:hypothetical protein